MDHALRDKILSILDRCQDMTIATVRPDGAPQATVVSFVHDGLQIYFGCGIHAQKAVNIARDRRVSLTVTAPYANWLQIEGLSLAGTATEVTSCDEKALVGTLMLKRFPELAGMQLEHQDDIKLFRVQPTMVSLLDYSKGFGHTDLIAMLADSGIGGHGGIGQEQAASAA